MEIRNFKKKDQSRAQNVILNGLKEYWGFIDTSLNPDVYDIKKAYVKEGSAFIVVELGQKIIGTGGLKRTEDTDMVQMVRVSVDKNYRRQGIAKKIVTHLLSQAVTMGYKKVLVETTKTWKIPRALYNDVGFTEIKETEEDVYMIRAL